MSLHPFSINGARGFITRQMRCRPRNRAFRPHFFIRRGLFPRSTFDHTPALCFWAGKIWRLRASNLRFKATVNVSFDHSLRCATILYPENEKKLQIKAFLKRFLSLN